MHIKSLLKQANLIMYNFWGTLSAPRGNTHFTPSFGYIAFSGTDQSETLSDTLAHIGVYR